MLDMFTIRRHKQNFDKLSVAIVGDGELRGELATQILRRISFFAASIE